MAHLIAFHETEALLFNPFEGGDGEQAIVNEIVTVPEPPRCHTCGGRLTPGTRCRHLVEQTGDKAEGDVPESIQRKEYWFCQHCCAAMAKDVNDGGDRLGSRTARMIANRERVATPHAESTCHVL
ncbi:hypothetical protein [Azospirillum picis]|uniref:Transposase n=1 Tax=Azospirillum picis TaxID=488438 RepID=A0ABU0MNS8_9PROT|nr:hypothetical protein [Azospirillum picis]MBP2301281.1 hypothetical protein [Azospirillum picis]MDQ0535112.1 hypothetical protein [Azospirillum picis]